MYDSAVYYPQSNAFPEMNLTQRLLPVGPSKILSKVYAEIGTLPSWLRIVMKAVEPVSTSICTRAKPRMTSGRGMVP